MRSLVLIAVLLLFGCAGLMRNPDDSTLERSGKIAARVVLAIPTFLISEAYIRDLEGQRDCDAVGGWWFFGACRENTAENRNRAMMLAPTMMQNATQGFQKMQQPLQPIPVAPVPPPVHCTSRSAGQMTYTDCY